MSAIITTIEYALTQQNDRFMSEVDDLEAAMISAPENVQFECPVTHRFTPGLYTREIFIPQGIIVVTLTHKTKHPFILLKGRMNLADENGKAITIESPHHGITMPGTRRVAIALEDCTWISFHATDATDPDAWLKENTYFQNKSAPKDFVPRAYKNRNKKLWDR